MKTSWTKSRRGRHGQATPIEFDRIRRAVDAWQRCADCTSWPKSIDTLLLLNWQGQEIAWPMFDTEGFSIFRVADSSVVDEEDLPSVEGLDWSAVSFSPPVTWATGACAA